MIDLQKMCLSWATANSCASDWLWLLEQAKGCQEPKTIDALFLKKTAARVPPHCRPNMMRIRSNLLTERMTFLDQATVEVLQKATENKVLRNIKRLSREEAEAFANQSTYHEWTLIAHCCASWVPQSEEFVQQEAWVKAGWRALLLYKLEPVSAGRRHLPLLYRHVPIEGSKGFVTINDESTLHGWNSVAVVLGALALIKYPDSPFYEGPVNDGFWLLKAAQETDVECSDPLSLVAMLEQFNYRVPVKQVHGPDIKIKPVEVVHGKQSQAEQEREKARKKAENERVRIEQAEDRYNAALEFARTAMAFAPSRADISARIAATRVNGIARYAALGAPSARVAWEQQERITRFVPWLGHEVTAYRWEFSLGQYSPIAFDNAFVSYLTGTADDSYWPAKWEAAVIASWLPPSLERFNSFIVGLRQFEKMQTAEGDMTLWEWYYRMHARTSFYKTKGDVRLRHIHALSVVDEKRGQMPYDIKDWLPLSFQKECPILLLKELGVW